MSDSNFITRDCIAAAVEICRYLNVFADHFEYARIDILETKRLFEDMRQKVAKLQAMRRGGASRREYLAKVQRNAEDLQEMLSIYTDMIDGLVSRLEETDLYHAHLLATDPKRQQALFDKEASRNG